MKWLTREKVKVDRVACPWLIKRMLEASVRIIRSQGKNGARLVFSLVVLVVGASETKAGSVYTPYAFTNFAGTVGGAGTTDGPATTARFNEPAGVATDSAGNVFVADGPNTIRKITPAGAVTTLAGSPGQVGSTDGSGSAARFNTPLGLAADSAGNLYVADSGNHSIRKVSPTGVVSTLAGSPGQAGSTDGTGSASRFNTPKGVAVDSVGNVYVGDTFNHTIRKLTSSGAVTTLAGSPGQYGSADGVGSAARFNSPMGVAVDSAGNVYVADSVNDTIRKITPAGLVTTLAGNSSQFGFSDGFGSAAQFISPQGVALDSAGNVYVAEETDDTIRKVTPAGVVTTLAGTPSLEGSADGVGSKALFYGPVGIAVDSVGNLYVADVNNSRITKGTQAYLQFRTSAGSLTVSNGAFHAWLTGPPNSQVILETSTNLQSWTPLQTNLLPPGGLSLSVPLNPNSRRFLRPRLGP